MAKYKPVPPLPNTIPVKGYVFINDLAKEVNVTPSSLRYLFKYSNTRVLIGNSDALSKKDADIVRAFYKAQQDLLKIRQ